MNYLPYANVVFRSPLKYEEACNRLADAIASKQAVFPFSYKRASKPYEGTLSNNVFEMHRTITYRNSFLPNIKGRIEKDIYSGGTIINVKMRLYGFVTAFMIFWCGMAAFAAAAILITTIGNSQDFMPALIPVVMLLFAYLMTTLGFGFESDKSIRDLQQIFDAVIDKK